MAARQSSKLVSFRLPVRLVEVIETRARATNRDRTAVVVEALSQAFGILPTVETPANPLQQLNQQIQDLKQQLEQRLSVVEAALSITPPSPEAADADAASAQNGNKPESLETPSPTA